MLPTAMLEGWERYCGCATGTSTPALKKSRIAQHGENSIYAGSFFVASISGVILVLMH